MTTATITSTTSTATPKVKRTCKPKTEAPAPVPATIGDELKLAVAQEQLKRGLATVLFTVLDTPRFTDLVSLRST